MKIFIKKLHKDAKLPTRAHHDDAGMDLYALGSHTVNPHETAIISTGISIKNESGYVGLILDKSSIASKGLRTLGGVIDASYRGEWKVIIHNLSDEAYTFEDGHKVAQILIQKVELPELVEVEDLDETIRGGRGFGSSGK
jgi:dUTP pyrophosphatase